MMKIQISKEIKKYRWLSIIGTSLVVVGLVLLMVTIFKINNDVSTFVEQGWTTESIKQIYDSSKLQAFSVVMLFVGCMVLVVGGTDYVYMETKYETVYLDEAQVRELLKKVR